MMKIIKFIWGTFLVLTTLTSCGGGGGTSAGATVPSSPSNVLAAAGNGKVTISWNSVSGASSYNIYMATTSGVTKSNYSSLTDGARHTSVISPYALTGLTNELTYYFVVTAVNNSVEGNESAEVSGTKFSSVTGGCVLDNVTGLMWENKTYDYGLHDVDRKYTNYSATYNGSSLFGSASDASGFVSAVNATNLCGYNDWRLPDINELQSIAAYSLADIATLNIWLPYGQRSGSVTTVFKWSSSPDVGNAFDSTAWSLSNGYGYVLPNGSRSSAQSVRLVRTARSQTTPRYTVSTNGQEVTDSKTKLIWRRCTEGMNWDGVTCSGVASSFTQTSALQLAIDQSISTGKSWRLPYVKELSSIADRSFINPAINATVFPATPSNLFWWTATPDSNDPSYSNWVVDFGNGAVYSGNQIASYVRLVRSSP